MLNFLLKSVFILGIMLNLSAYASTSINVDAGDSTEENDSKKWDDLLFSGMEMIQKGQFQEAIDATFEPIITHYEAKYVNSEKRIYIARTLAENMAYLMKPENKQYPHGAVVLSDFSWIYAYYGKAYSLVELQQFSEAEAALAKALYLSPFNPQFLSELGALYRHKKDWEKMLAIFKEAEASTVMASPENVKSSDLGKALRGQGYALVELGRLDEALQRYQKSLEIDPSDTMSKGEIQYISDLKKKAP